MDNFLYSVDISEMKAIPQVMFHLEGWAALPQHREIKVEVMSGDGESIPAEIIYKKRPDIVDILVGAELCEKPGFCVHIHDVPYVYENFDKWGLYLLDGEDKKPLYESDADSLRQEYKKDTMAYNIDRIELKGSKAVIYGWALDAKTLKPLPVELRDEKDQVLPSKIKPLLRLDINEIFQIPDEELRCGFSAEVDKEDCGTRMLKVCMGNAEDPVIEEIDIMKFFAQNSKSARLRKALKNKEARQKAFQEGGIGGFFSYLKCEMEDTDSDYNIWFNMHRAGKKTLEKQRNTRFEYEPLISIVIPLYNTPLKYLKELIASLQNQTYQNLEICLSDGSTEDTAERFIEKAAAKDSRIIYKRLEKNLGISGNTNAALDMAKGDYIMLADHDDLVTPDALFEIVSLINETGGKAQMIYTDEDKIDMEGKMLFEPNFKSDFNPDLLRCVNYMCHITVISRELLEKTGGFDPEYDGAQDHDLFLRCIENTDEVYHIPKILYHWRCHPSSTAEDPDSKRYAFDAGKKAVKEHFKRTGIEAEVENTIYAGIYRSRFKINGEPKISILIPNKDHISDLDKCIKSVIEKSTYRNWEIIVIENNSEDEKTFEYYEKIKSEDPRIKVVKWEGPFNYSAINNFGAGFASGEYYLLLNNDIEIITPGWMEEMLGFCQREDVAACGAKLYYPDGTVQHAGVILGIGGVAGHVLCHEDADSPGYAGRLVTVQNLSAVTAACLMVKKSVYEEVGGLDESYAVAFNDVDFCMKIRAAGYKIVFTPFAEMIHYESKSRGYEDTPKKQKRFAGEIKRFQEKWGKELEAGDPYYNPNLTLEKTDCSFVM